MDTIHSIIHTGTSTLFNEWPNTGYAPDVKVAWIFFRLMSGKRVVGSETCVFSASTTVVKYYTEQV